MHQEVKPRDFYEAWKEIEKMRYYFYKFAGQNAEEAMENTLMHVLTHFDSSKGYLPDYVRKLARTIEKKNNRLVLVDFLEEKGFDYVYVSRAGREGQLILTDKEEIKNARDYMALILASRE